MGRENLFPGDYDYIRQGRGHNVCLAVSRDGAEQAVDVCFDLTAAPAGDFSLAFDGGLTLAYADADRTCCLAFTDDAMSGGRTSRYVKLDAPCRRLRVVGDAPAWGCKTLPVPEYFCMERAFFAKCHFLTR